MENEFKEKETTQPVPTPPISPAPFGAGVFLDTQMKKAGLAALIVLLLILSVGFAASKSLPGGALYGMKTGFLEQLNEAVQFTPGNKAAYQVARMEERLNEIKALSKKEKIDPEALRIFQELSTAHHDRLIEIINTPENGISRTDSLAILNDFASVAAAIENISEHTPQLSSIGEAMEDLRHDTVNTYKDMVDRFVERETPENIYAFIAQQLQDISGKLDTGEVSQEVIDDAEVYINRVGPAVAKSDFPRAISAIAEAFRFIKIAEYGGRIEDAPAATTATSTPETATTSETSETPSGGGFNFSE